MSSGSGWSAGRQTDSQVPFQQQQHHHHQQHQQQPTHMQFDDPAYSVQQNQAQQQHQNHQHPQFMQHHHTHSQVLPDSGESFQHVGMYATQQSHFYNPQHVQTAAFASGPSAHASTSSPSHRSLQGDDSTLSSAFGASTAFPSFQQGGGKVTWTVMQSFSTQAQVQ